MTTKQIFSGLMLLMLLAQGQLNAQTTVVIKQKADPPPIFILDGKEVNVSGTGDLNKLIDPNDIASIDVFKGEKAIALYGERAINGVVSIKSKRPGEFKSSSVPPIQLKDSRPVLQDPEGAVKLSGKIEWIMAQGYPRKNDQIDFSDYIIMINDKVADSAQLASMGFSSVNNDWNIGEITVVEVYKGKENVKKVFKGDLGNKKGVMVIRTRKKPI